MIMKDNLEQIQILKIKINDYVLLNNRIYKIIGVQTERVNQRFVKYVVKFEDVETKETMIEKYNPTFKFDKIIDITKVK